MITDRDRKKMKHIPHRNSKMVQEILKENGKRIYSDKYIRNVFRGIYENIDIEEAYYILNSRLAIRKRQIKKPEAGTPGL